MYIDEYIRLSSNWSDEQQLSCNSEKVFQPNAYWIITFYVIPPILVPIGLIGNIICLIVIIRQFAKEMAFLYQVVIITADFIYLCSMMYLVVGHFWGVGTHAIFPKHCKYKTSFWFERQYMLVFILQYIASPVCQFTVNASPALLVASGIDRAVAMAKPMYYKAHFPRKTLIAVTIVFAIAAGIPSSVEAVIKRTIITLDIETSLGNVTVYKRFTTVKESPVPNIMGIVSGSIRALVFLTLTVVSIVVLRLYRKTYEKQIELNRQPIGINPRILTKLMLAQCVLVGLCLVPLALAKLSFYFISHTWHRSFMTMIRPNNLRDIAYALQVSMNVFMYASVSKRFRRALKGTLTCTEVDINAETPRLPQHESRNRANEPRPPVSNDIVVYSTGNGSGGSNIPQTEPKETSLGSIIPPTEPKETSLGSKIPPTEPKETSLGSDIPPTEPKETSLGSNIPPTEPKETSLGSDIPPTEPKETSLGSDTPPTEPKETSLGSNIPPTEPKETSLESDIPPTEPKETSLGSDIPPTEPKETSLGSDIPPTEPKETSLGSNIPPTEPKETSLGSDIPPTEPKETSLGSNIPPTEPKETSLPARYHCFSVAPVEHKKSSKEVCEARVQQGSTKEQPGTEMAVSLKGESVCSVSDIMISSDQIQSDLSIRSAQKEIIETTKL